MGIMSRFNPAPIVFCLCLWGSMLPASGQEVEKKPFHAPQEVLVKFKAGTDEAEKSAIRDELGATLIRAVRRSGLEHWRLPETVTAENALDFLKNQPAVEHVEVNYLFSPQVHPDDPAFHNLWFLENTGLTVQGSSGRPGADISAPEAWEMETGDPALIIAVIDSGVAFDHPDLIDNIWNNPGEIPDNGIDDDANGYVDDTHGWDFFNNRNDPTDYSRDLAGDGHGTHVAGIIAASGNNGIGVTGVMWQAAIMPLQIFNLFETSSVQKASARNSDIISAIEYAVENGAKIINCSFAGSSFSQFLYDAFEYAHQQGVLAVAAAGNGPRNNDEVPTYPANYDLPNILSVAATDNGDNLAPYSNYGAKTVDVAAPGGNSFANIYSTTPPQRETLFFENFEFGDGLWEKGAVHENWSLADDAQFESTVIRDSAGNYSDNENAWIKTRFPVNVRDYRGLHIEFLARYSLERDYDFLFVEGSNDGVNFPANSPVTGFVTGFSNGISRVLGWGSNTAAGDSLYLRFRLVSDGSTNYDGVFLDDIRLTGIQWEFDGDEYEFKSGTSMAAPVVSGIAGLVWSNRPDLTHLEVRDIILNSVEEMDNLSNRVVSGGRVDAARALEMASGEISADPAPSVVSSGGGGGGGGGGCFIDDLGA